METIKNNLNEKVRNLIEEVQKLNTLINCFGKAMLRECQYSRWKCLEINGIPSSVSDKDLEEVVCMAITKAGVDFTTDDIEDCHRVGNKGPTIIKFGKRTVLTQVLSVRKDLEKVKMSDIDLTRQSTGFYGPKLEHCIKNVRLTAFMYLMTTSK